MEWLIENDVFEDGTKRLTDVLKDLDIGYSLHECGNLDDSYKHGGDGFSCFCYGSLEWVDQIQKSGNKNLKTICTFPNFNCTEYYKHFSHFLFNRNGRFMTIEQFMRQFDALLTEYGGQVFMRPSTGLKPAGTSGTVFNDYNFQEFIPFFLEDFTPQESVVVNKVIHIDTEWRTIVANNRFITGCQYRTLSPETKRLGFDPSPDCPVRVQNYVNHVVNAIEWKPDDIYVLDVVDSQGHLQVMEINALSTSGYYDCSYPLIVNAIQSYFKE